ncbi:hypothetical protein BSL82_16170 [Tardibacter chloracetimidivorans]|uniref:Glycosyltransferase 2-like domain-containing protein n=1 Tax=Tardibacter chloracetimidivorans TaxID=1921510 RepID=A0A1L3ZYE8_9SPHN|nr:glycosyltransferase [Tardibacter chloracetimidivorans]API60635.1 hypothetical protein BSL82_16170 [Tardibacter chloracetimidivorans]
MLYIILPVHNRAETTSLFLDALQRQTFQDFLLVLVDDGCTDETVSIAREKIPSDRLIVLQGDGQLWWAGALNLAYYSLIGKLADNDVILIINDDVTFAEDFLAKGLDALRRHPGGCLQAVGTDPRSSEVDCGTIADLIRLTFRAARPGETPNCLSTRGLMLDAAMFKASGGFRPRWLPHYLSDYEFTLRLQRKGVRLAVEPGFCAQTDLSLTGMGQPTATGVVAFWRQSFSNRAKFNPKHWTAFVLLTCPAWIAPFHIVRIWGRFARGLLATATHRTPDHA